MTLCRATFPLPNPDPLPLPVTLIVVTFDGSCIVTLIEGSGLVMLGIGNSIDIIGNGTDGKVKLMGLMVGVLLCGTVMLMMGIPMLGTLTPPPGEPGAVGSVTILIDDANSHSANNPIIKIMVASFLTMLMNYLKYINLSSD